jgi:hypothetical protein
MVWDMESYPQRLPLDTMLGSPPEIRPERLDASGAKGFDVSCEVGIFPGAGESGLEPPGHKASFSHLTPHMTLGRQGDGRGPIPVAGSPRRIEG